MEKFYLIRFISIRSLLRKITEDLTGGVFQDIQIAKKIDYAFHTGD
jgi:hypothetical protein